MSTLPATPADLFTGPTDTDAPFVRVLTDPATGRAIIALDAAAASLLVQLLDDIGPGYDLAVNPGYYGLDADTANQVAAVRSAITGPLGKVL